MPKFSISNIEKNKLKNILVKFKNYFSGEQIRAELFNANIDLEVPNGYIEGYDLLYYKKNAINYIFEKIENDNVLLYISKIYLNIFKDKSPDDTKFLDEINKGLITLKIKLNKDGSFTDLDEELIEYEEKLISDLFDKFGLADIKGKLEKAKELLHKAITENDSIDSTMSAQQSGIALEGVLKFIYFQIMKNNESSSVDDLDKSINYYLDKLSSNKIKFIERDEALFKIIDAIRLEFRNIGSHYTIVDIESFESVRVEINSASLCLWTSKAVILSLLKKYEEQLDWPWIIDNRFKEMLAQENKSEK